MSLLLIDIPPRPRLAARLAGAEPAGEAGDGRATLPTEWSYVFSSDGRTVSRSGRTATALLPRAENVVAVLAASDLSWHRLTLPRASAARMRAALDGALEEALLDDTQAVHFALAPKSAAPGATWVAATQRGWLSAVLAELESSGLSIDRVVPGAEPASAASATSAAAAAHGHFTHQADVAEDDPPLLTLAHASGVASLRIVGSLPRALVTRVVAAAAAADTATDATGATDATDVTDGTVTWSATPAAATAAERWLGAPVAVVGEPQHLLSRASSAWNLRQFDLVARRRGTRLLGAAARRFFTREWRLQRWGLVALVAVQLIGLNAYAWQQQRSLAQKREALNTLLRSTHPQVRTVLDAPLQMLRETEALRIIAGRAGDADLETLLAAAATAWPDGAAPVQTLRFESGRLLLSAPGLGAAQVAAMSERLRALGLDATWQDGRAVISRGAARAG